MIEAAVAYAGRGWPVFPCRPMSKIPATLNGFNDATIDEAKIREWWTACPTLNIGIRTGAISGFVVIDLDYRPPDDGWVSWTRLMDELSIPYHRTFTVSTPSDGMHMYYLHPGVEIRNSTSKLGPGIDVRADKGCITAPPSVTETGIYDVISTDTPMASLPEVLVELLKPAPPPSALERALRMPDFTLDANSYVAKAVAGEVQRVLDAEHGTRNDTLVRASFKLGQLVGGAVLDHSEAWHALTTAGEAVGLPRHEVEATVRSGLKAGADKPRIKAST
jgi:hypothetical protein